jgi:multiple sugar transport system permease protein
MLADMPLKSYGETRAPWLADAVIGLAFSAPAFIFMMIFLIVPMIAVLAIALTDWTLGAKTLAFVGFANFAALFGDPVFRASLANTFIYVAIVVPGTTLLGLAVALLIESGGSLRAFYRTAHFLPVMTTLAAMAIVWEALLHPSIGLVNQILLSIGLPAINWLRDDRTVLVTLAALGIWQQLGFAMVLFLAGLKAIPRELYDAADTDGADGVLDRLRTVTLPMLSPVTMLVVVIVALRAFEVFDTVKILTQGGPDKASEVLLYTLYVESFEFLRTSYGAAITVIFLIIVATLTLLQVRISERRVHY